MSLQSRSMACQNNGPRTTGMRTVSTDLWTEAPRGGAVTRSPDTGLTPKAWVEPHLRPLPPAATATGRCLGHQEGAGLV